MRVSRIASRRIHIYNTLEISDVSGVINFLVVDVTKIALSLVHSVCLSFFLSLVATQTYPRPRSNFDFFVPV